jgi:hypothetical protein
MIKIEFPPYQPKVKTENGKELIFDEVRKRWVGLTPEEWVRQNFLKYLIEVKKYPASLIAVEKEIFFGELKKRCDIVVYKKTKPWMIVECKEMKEQLNESVIKQILNYHTTLQVNFLVVTNGEYTYAVEINKPSYTWLKELPEFS